MIQAVLNKTRAASEKLQVFQSQVPSLLMLFAKGTLALVIGLVVLIVSEKIGWFEARKESASLFYGYIGFIGGGVYGLRAAWMKTQPRWQSGFLSRICFGLGYLSGGALGFVLAFNAQN